MFAFIISVHVVVSVFLIFVILLQPGKGAGGMAAFSGGGGGASTTAFGGRGSVTFLSKVTTVCAIVFMLTSLTLAWRSSHSDSVLRARRNLAAQEAKTPAGAKPLAPATNSVPAPVTGGAAPSPAPAAPAAPSNPAAPAAPSKK